MTDDLLLSMKLVIYRWQEAADGGKYTIKFAVFFEINNIY